ncbi:hypothetical protein D3C84_1142240 [compost metagenome]
MVEPQSEVVAIEHADQLEGVGSRREARQGLSSRSGRRFAMVMPLAGLSSRGGGSDQGRHSEGCQPWKQCHLCSPLGSFWPYSGSRPSAWRSEEVAAA